jgi:hypothetical protein
MNKSLIAVLLVACLALATATEEIAHAVHAEESQAPDVDVQDDGDKIKLPVEDLQDDGDDKIKIPTDDLVQENNDPVDHTADELDDPVDHKVDEVDVQEEEGKDRRHAGEASTIRKLLNGIKKKLAAELRAAQGHVSRVTAVENRRVAAAYSAYRKATTTASHANNVRNRDLGRYNAAVSVRERNILHAKEVQHAEVHRREKELLLIHSIECRLLELTNNVEAVKGCQKALKKRQERFHVSGALAGGNARVYSGYCSSHSRGSGWDRYCLNRKEFQHGAFVSAHSNGVVTIRKTGMYRLHARTIQYCANWCGRHLRTLVDGRQIDYAYKQHAHSWVETELDKMYHLKAGQNVQFHMYSSGSNPYRWHSGNGHGAHSRVQITFMGRKPLHSSMCAQSRGAGWHYYCNNRVERTHPSFFKNTNTYIEVKHSGMYRINARALVYTSGWGQHHQEIIAANRRVSYTHDYKHGWAVAKGDVMWPLKAGHKVYVRYYSNNGHAYHAGSLDGAHSVTQVSFEGPASKPVASYYCSSHNRNVNSWQTYCLNGKEFNTASRFVTVHSSGLIRVLKSGTYRINAWALSHEQSYRQTNSRVLVNGTYYSYCHTHDYSWNRRGNDFMWRLKAGSNVHIQYHSSGNYNWHAGWTHSRVQISFEGSY